MTLHLLECPLEMAPIWLTYIVARPTDLVLSGPSIRPSLTSLIKYPVTTRRHW